MTNLSLQGASPPPSTGRASLMTALLLALVLTTGCAGFNHHTPGDVPANTQLAISPDGNRLVVSWNDRSGKLKAKLIELQGDQVASTRELELPPKTYTTAFANNNDELLVTTLENKKSDLLKVNLNSNEAKQIYKSSVNLRFPLEVSNENYVFLEGQDPDSRTNSWQRLQNGEKTLLNPKNYGLASRLDVVGEALFILEPWTPPAFRNIYGRLPKGLSALVDKTTFSIICADKNPLVCVRTHLGSTDDGRYFSTIEILNGSQRCDIAGRWIDAREVVISRNGTTVAFHAAIENHDGPRAIHIIKNVDAVCLVKMISIK
jgi:hypothetical protein